VNAVSGRRAKEQRRRAGSGFDAASPAPSRVLWTERLSVAGVLTGALMPFVPTSAFALPQGGTVAAGAATISTPTATSMRVDQTTDRAIVDWKRFNIAANESVRFQQPNAASIALNRVSGQEPSAIFGSLSANGQIFLLNPSGILFGSSSRVDVGALTASTLTMSNQDFLAGQYRFTQDATRANAAVINQGLITAGPGGYVAL
jgi:filamentous hemagglutinin family protein